MKKDEVFFAPTCNRNNTIKTSISKICCLVINISAYLSEHVNVGDMNGQTNVCHICYVCVYI